MKTLEQYLIDAADTVTTMHTLVMKPRATATDPEGNVTQGPVCFYIHPCGADGETLDFEVQGNSLAQDPSITYAEDPLAAPAAEEVKAPLPEVPAAETLPEGESAAPGADGETSTAPAAE